MIYVASAIAFPNVFLFNVYNQNRESAQIVFSHVLIWALIFAVVSVVGFFVTKLLTRTYEGSLIINVSAWLAFWFFEAGLRRMPIDSRVLFLGLILVFLICLVVLFRLLSGRLQRVNLIFTALAGVIVVLFVLNAFPTFVTAITGSRNEASGEFSIRRDFNVDASLPHPDIYWLLVDGMISLESKEAYFGEPQDETRARLLDLGFVINEHAEFVAHNTTFGMPGLLSPDFYDSYLHELFMEGRYSLRRRRHAILNDAVARDQISFANDVAAYHELFHAFLQGGYRAVMIADFDPTVYTPIHQFYRLDSDGDALFAVGDGTSDRHFLINMVDLMELLSLMTPVPGRLVTAITEGRIGWEDIPAHEDEVNQLTAHTLNLPHERRLYRALIDVLENATSQPRLTFATLMFTHANRWSWQVEEEGDASRTDLLPIAHDYALYVMFNMIDLILERNPDAIIVIQADHGLHLHTTQRQLLDEGFSEEEVIRLHNSVMSAVRIPESYGGLDAPLDPRNITRELVNRFVGPNYELLSE